MNNDTPGSRMSQRDRLATRWTDQQIIYLHLPSRMVPGSTYIFPLVLCPSPLPGKKQ